MACVFTSSGAAARKFRYEAEAGNIGINIGVAAPMAFFPFSGWKNSFFGTLHAQGKHAVEFFTQTKVVVERWLGRVVAQVLGAPRTKPGSSPSCASAAAGGEALWRISRSAMRPVLGRCSNSTWRARRPGTRRCSTSWRETGYVGTELGDWGFMPTDPDALAAELDSRRLTHARRVRAGGAEGSRRRTRPASESALKVARLLRATADRTTPGPSALPGAGRQQRQRSGAHEERRPDHAGDGPERRASGRSSRAGAERVAQAVRDETGLRTVFHHHCAGYVETPDEIARLLDLTDPAVARPRLRHRALCLRRRRLRRRVGRWAANASPTASGTSTSRTASPKWRRSRAREGWDYFESVRHGVFCELGKGCVDFPAVAGWLRTRPDLKWGIVEQDVLPGMGTPKESAARNRAYLRSIGL